MPNGICKICGYIYGPNLGDPDNDIPGSAKFEDLPDVWLCPSVA